MALPPDLYRGSGYAGPDPVCGLDSSCKATPSNGRLYIRIFQFVAVIIVVYCLFSVLIN